MTFRGSVPPPPPVLVTNCPTLVKSMQHTNGQILNAESGRPSWFHQGVAKRPGLFFPIMRLRICRPPVLLWGTWASLSPLVSALCTTLFCCTRALQTHKIETFSWRRRRRRRSLFNRSCTCAFAYKTVRSFFNWHREKPIERVWRPSSRVWVEQRTRSLQLLSLSSFFTC
jgi:hypothetical protein